MKITYKPAGFKAPPPLLLPGERSLNFTRASLLRSAVTVGRRNWADVFQHGGYSRLEIIWRAAMLASNIEMRDDGLLRWSPAYVGLDPSERGAISYFVGMTFAKLLSERLLEVPWLMHLDVYWKLLSPVLQNGEKRPDLVGNTATGTWIAVEAKGGAGNLKRNGWVRAKDQLSSLTSVGGAPIQQGVVSVTFQRKCRRSPGLHVEFRDPPAAESGFDLPVSRSEFLADYYQHVRRIVGEEVVELPGFPSATGSSCVGAYIPEIDAWIGIAEELMFSRHLARDAAEYSLIAQESSRGQPGQRPLVTDLSDIGTDGVAVLLGGSWERRFVRGT